MGEKYIMFQGTTWNGKGACATPDLCKDNLVWGSLNFNMVSLAPHGPRSSPLSPPLLSSQDLLLSSEEAGPSLPAQTTHCFESPTALDLGLEWIFMFDYKDVWKYLSLKNKNFCHLPPTVLYRSLGAAVPRTCWREAEGRSTQDTPSSPNIACIIRWKHWDIWVICVSSMRIPHVSNF